MSAYLDPSIPSALDRQYQMDKTLFSGLLACALAGLIGEPVLAETGKQPESQCTVSSTAGSIRVLVCSPGLDQSALHLAGQSACGDELNCNAWIWDSPEKAPKNAPRSDADIDQEHARDAVAIWANDSKHLMLVKRLSK
jgi:hypothetical protein